MMKYALLAMLAVLCLACDSEQESSSNNTATPSKTDPTKVDTPKQVFDKEAAHEARKYAVQWMDQMCLCYIAAKQGKPKEERQACIDKVKPIDEKLQEALKKAGGEENTELVAIVNKVLMKAQSCK